jgi:hypothetical protein
MTRTCERGPLFDERLENQSRPASAPYPVSIQPLNARLRRPPARHRVTIGRYIAHLLKGALEDQVRGPGSARRIAQRLADQGFSRGPDRS